MKPYVKSLIITCFVLLTPHANAAKCSRANLTKCLDSACAINIGTNPAARCQYCGTSDAGTPPTDNGMRNITVGASSKTTISDKELKKAPTDPGARYVWASEQCLSKVAGCTPDDISEAYDSLIEQSCTAAGVNSQAASARAKNAKKMSKSQCTTDIRNCVIRETKCGADYASCKDDTDFNKIFSECIVASGGCDAYTADLKTTLLAARDEAFENASQIIDTIVNGYQAARKNRIASIKSGCNNSNIYNQCIETVCSTNFGNTCDSNENSRIMARNLCKFYELACETVK